MNREKQPHKEGETQSPLVTVWIPVYNGGDMIGKAIESCLNQTYRNLEVLVFDDCSTDDTKAVTERYAERDGRVKYVNSGGRLGFTRSLPAIFKNASGEYTLFLAHDDWLSRNCIEACVETFAADPGMGVVMPRNFTVVERNGSYTLREEANVKSGVYTRDWFGRNSYRNFMHSMVFLGLMRRADAEDVAVRMNRFIEHPPVGLPDELKELITHEYVADILFPVPLVAKHERLAVIPDAAYLKTDLPEEHYRTRKGSMGLRGKFGIGNDTARGILKLNAYYEATYEAMFRDEWRNHIPTMRIFFGKETLSTIFIEALRRRFSREFFKDFGVRDLNVLFSPCTSGEKAALLILFPVRLLERFAGWLARKLTRTSPPEVRTENNFLSAQGVFTV